MSTHIFRNRSEYFDEAQAAALALLDDKGFSAPEHPYIATLRSMIDYAVMGVVDVHNGLLHTERIPFEGCVVIVPLVEDDVRSSRDEGFISVAHSLTRSYDVDTQVQVRPSELKKYSGMCEYDKEFLNPIIWLPPWLRHRPKLNLGATVVHEADHAYWYSKNRRILGNQKVTPAEQLACLEISAYRLEQQLYFAHLAGIYDDQYARVHARFTAQGYETEYKPRNNNKLVKGATAVAIANVLFDMLGGEVKVKPSRAMIRAMRLQKLL